MGPDGGPQPSRGRDIVLAVDTESFDADVWQRTVDSVRAFLRALPPADRVGIYAYRPVVAEAPSTDRARIGQVLSAIGARGRPLWTRYNLRPSEIVDVNAEAALARAFGFSGRAGANDARADSPTIQAIQARECPTDTECQGRIMTDAVTAMREMETRALRAVDGLASMLSALRTWPGHKTVIILSGGLAVSDSPGARPESGDVDRIVAAHVAGSDVVVYTLFVDEAARSPSSAVRRTSARGANPARDLRMQSSWLERLSMAAGGALVRAGQDYGEAALRQVLTETSAHYLLGVEVAPEERDGQARSLRVRIRGREATLRSPSWVVVPR